MCFMTLSVVYMADIKLLIADTSILKDYITSFLDK